LKSGRRQILPLTGRSDPIVPILRERKIVFRTFRNIESALFLVLFLASCSGSANVTSPEDGESKTEETVILADYETFDASKYVDPPPELGTQVEHDVPRLLMESRADSGVVRIVDGYRIQIFQTLDRDLAVAAEEKVRSWWQSHPPDPDSLVNVDSVAVQAFPTVLSVYNLYRQPYYRVRIGDFVDKEAAERVHDRILRPFPGSLIVPDRITVERR
jgi:hypothetical protein